MTESGSEERTAELSLHVLANFVQYIADVHGARKLSEILDPIDLAADDFNPKTWASLAQVEHILAEGRRLFDDERAFKAAFAYKLKETLGPMRFLAWAATPGQVFTQAFKSLGTFSTISRAEIVERDSSSLVIRYFSDKPESRNLCLSRQGQASALPTLWGLPPAVFTERCCLADGADHCEYRITWYEPRRRTPALLGMAVGLAAALTLGFATSGTSALSWVVLPLLGAFAGIAYEMRRTHAAHIRTATQQQDALREMAESDASARQELLLLHERQRNWARLLEEQTAERNASFQEALERYEDTLRQQRVTIRGVTHDMNGYLAVLKNEGYMLEQIIGSPSEEIEEVLEMSSLAVEQLERMVSEFVKTAREEGSRFVPSNPEPLPVEGLAATLRRRLVALSYGKELRLSVFATREAPDSIRVDRMLFDRVVDNLLTNAVKYTASGSIVLEIGGTPGFMSLKVSDTGRGIPDDQIGLIFRAGGSDPTKRAANSHGVGLSVVVQLLAQVGGRLEVMSKPGIGTTFWAHFPVDSEDAAEEPPTARRSDDEILADVVNIRQVHGR